MPAFPRVFTGSSRIEALRLYRDILRSSRLFVWANADGEPWSNVIRKNARKEFEQARHERDPEMVARLLVVGRESLNQTMEKFYSKAQKIADDMSNPPRT